MKEDQLAAIRDALIAELPTPKSSAVKFEGALQDKAIRTNSLGKTSDQAELDAIKNEIRATSAQNHALCVALLKSELANDPSGVGYADMTPSEIQVALISQRPINVDVPAKTEMQEIIDSVLATMTTRPADLAVFADGAVESSNASAAVRISQAIGALVQKSGKTEQELMAPRTRQQFTGNYMPPPISVIWQGIPYTYNTPPIEVIQEALA